jgi:uncharacterized protein YcfJ
MNTRIRKTFVGASLLSMLVVSAVQAQSYGPQDEGRRFNDGTVVKCHKEEVQKNSSDPNRVGGTVAGAVVGGLVGSRFGSGSGKKLATVGGAVAGGATGRYIQGQRQESHGDRAVETVCERVRR